jgi:nucleotidyltransferase/DNA polymerase involved in DNA repair
LQLNEMKGLGTTTVEKLAKGGIKTVEQLALIDTRKAKITGMNLDKLVELRRQAQKAIFLSAAVRFSAMAKSARREASHSVEALERVAKSAAENALAAAKEAEAYATEALKHAEAAAIDLADYAAQQAQRAQQAAAKQLQSLSEKIAGAGVKSKPLVDKYVELLRRAEGAAAVAAKKAQDAAGRAKIVGSAAASRTSQKGKSFYERIVKRRTSKKE